MIPSPKPPGDLRQLHTSGAEGEHPRERYWRVLLDVAPRLLSLLDREQRSPTRGSFDRVNWGWKFRDFPLTMWQASMMPLATLWRTPHPDNRYHAQPELAEWLEAALSHTLGRQHPNGAFDSFTPYSQDHGVTLAMVLTIATTAELLDDALPPALRQRAREAIARACRFAQSSDEDYAFINNHQAAFALAYLRAARFTGDASLRERGDAVIDRILGKQSPDGWFEEYGGPDPGYETFGLTYLALANVEHARSDVTRALARSVAFLSHCVHPDGSVGGNYGSRNTGQYAPGGLEVLASHDPLAASIADFLGSRAGRGNLVSPAGCDDDNLPLLTWSYAVAATSAARRGSPPVPLPCERDDVLTRFDASRIVVASTQRYFAVTNGAKGGVLRLFDRQREALVYEDAGYVLQEGGRDWSTQLLGESRAVEGDSSSSPVVEAQVSAVKRELLTPLKFLVLRILNLTVFRSVRLGAMVRRMIIARLITGRDRGRWCLRRRVSFEPDRVVLRDELFPRGGSEEPVRVTSVSLERSLLPVHMGSAKYFHANELAVVPRPRLDEWLAVLNAGSAAGLTQVIGFVDGAVTYRHEAGSAPGEDSMERKERPFA